MEEKKYCAGKRAWKNYSFRFFKMMFIILVGVPNSASSVIGLDVFAAQKSLSMLNLGTQKQPVYYIRLHFFVFIKS